MAVVEIRRLVTADLAAYKSLRDDMLAAYPESFTSDVDLVRPPESYASRLGTDDPKGGGFTLGAWQAERLIGAITCERDGRAKVRHIGHLVGMMVRNEAQGNGIGRALIVECIARARASGGLQMLTLSVTAGNLKAIHLYERIGFLQYASLSRAMLVGGIYHAKNQMVLSLSDESVGCAELGTTAEGTMPS